MDLHKPTRQLCTMANHFTYSMLFSIFSLFVSSFEGFYAAAVLSVLVALTNFKINMACMEKAHC